MSAPVSAETQTRLIEVGQFMVAFSLESLEVFRDLILGSPSFDALLHADGFRNETYYMALCDDQDRVDADR